MLAARMPLCRRRVAILIAEHRLYFQRDLVDRIIYMRDRKIEKEFTQEEFKAADDRPALLLKCVDFFFQVADRRHHRFKCRDISVKHIFHSLIVCLVMRQTGILAAQKVGEDSSLQRMIRLVESADAGKADCF